MIEQHKKMLEMMSELSEFYASKNKYKKTKHTIIPIIKKKKKCMLKISGN